jgi:hypothetical protein
MNLSTVIWKGTAMKLLGHAKYDPKNTVPSSDCGTNVGVYCVRNTYTVKFILR